jgi:hypothetical protein
MGKKLSFEEVNKRLEEGNRSVRLVGEYFGANENSLFKCLICGLEWMTRPSNVLNRSNCPHCFGTHKSSVEITNELLKTRNILMIGEYINANVNSLFKCLVCDWEWVAAPSSILNAKTGCPCCSCRIQLTKEIVNSRLEKSNRNILLIGDYITNKDNSLFKCLVCDHSWMARPDAILNRSGCPICAKYGFDKTKPAILYYIEIYHNNNKYYKIGITNRSVENRFLKCETHKISTILEKQFDLGIDAYKIEQNILSEYDKYRYNGEQILSSGNTEIFTKDIRELGFKIY